MAKHVNKLTKNQNLNENSISHIDQVKREIKLAAFFAEHNVAFTTDHLTSLLKNIFIDSRIAQDFSLTRTKCSKIVKEVIAKREIEKLVENLRFSILIDERLISRIQKLCALYNFYRQINN